MCEATKGAAGKPDHHCLAVDWPALLDDTSAALGIREKTIASAVVLALDTAYRRHCPNSEVRVAFEGKPMVWLRGTEAEGWQQAAIAPGQLGRRAVERGKARLRQLLAEASERIPSEPISPRDVQVAGPRHRQRETF